MRDELLALVKGGLLALTVTFLAYHAAKDLLHIRDTYGRGSFALVCAVVITAISPVRR